MSWSERLLGPPSKYVRELPYTYEARVSVLEWDDAYNSYYSDTICGLIDFLRQKNIRPDQVTLIEVFQDHESEVETCWCLDSHEMWLTCPKLCHSLQGHYRGHIDDSKCSFRDRNRMAFGP